MADGELHNREVDSRHLSHEASSQLHRVQGEAGHHRRVCAQLPRRFTDSVRVAGTRGPQQVWSSDNQLRQDPLYKQVTFGLSFQ